MLEESKKQIAKWKEVHRLALKKNLSIKSVTPNAMHIDVTRLKVQLFEAMNHDLLITAFVPVFNSIVSNFKASLLLPDDFKCAGKKGQITYEYSVHEERNYWYKLFIDAANLLGLLQKDPEEWFRGGLDYDALVEEYDSVRAQALAAKEAGDKAAMGAHFNRSDEIRDQFKAEGVVIESGAGGKSGWRKA